MVRAEAGKKGFRSHDRLAAAAAVVCLSKRDQRLCLRAKQANGSESETGYGEEFRGNEKPDVQERGAFLRDEGTQWIFVENGIKTLHFFFYLLAALFYVLFFLN